MSKNAARRLFPGLNKRPALASAVGEWQLRGADILAAERPLLAARGLYKAYGGVVPTDNVDIELKTGHIHSLICPKGAGKTTLLNILSGIVPPDRGSIESRQESTMADVPLLQVEGLEVRYGAIEALKGISLEVRACEVVTIIGGNGSGKSTLMKTISGLEDAVAGRVLFEGRDITRLPGHKRVPLGIAQSPEGRQVFPDQTVHDNLMLGAYHRKVAAEIAADIEAQFEIFPRLRERQHQMAGTMSGGEQQMLAIARALMSRPKLLLLDEPSLGLAPLVVKEIFSVIRSLKARGVTILLVEQMANQALAVAERAYVLETGRITIQGRGADLRRDPKVRAAYLGEH